MKSIELFSGTGGLALGLLQAGFEHEALFEWDKDSCDNLKYNIINGYPGVKDWSVFQTEVLRASRSPLEENIRHTTTSAICSPKRCVPFGKRGRRHLFSRM